MVKKSVGYLLVVFLLLSLGWAEEKKVEFDGNRAHSYIKDMAADSMLGRKSGQSGGVMGEEYIATKFKEWGLEPAGDNGSYFQEFTIEHTNVSEGVVFEVITDKARRDFYNGEDWRVLRHSGSGHFSTEIVKADLDRRELTNIFSTNLMRIMDKARGIQEQGFSF